MKDKIQNKMIKNMRNMCSWGERRFNNLTPEQKDRQRGITMIEITAGLVIIALLAIFLVPRVGALLGKSKIESGVQEITLLVTAFEQYRLVNGKFTSISFEKLENEGYHIEPFGETNKANAFGQDIVLTNAGTTGLLLSYDTAGSQADCKQIETRILKLSPVASVINSGVLEHGTDGVVCTAGVVKFKIGQ